MGNHIILDRAGGMLSRAIRLFFLFSGVFGSVVGQDEVSPRHEFRGAWIATVDNIDWPSRKGLSSAEQQSEFIQMLDLHKANGMNAIIMQIRPAADAFYPSSYEPWSEWLTGVQGKAPEPYYDPLQFMVEETHKRGMEFHAWLNPYRAVFNINRSSVASDHITRKQPGWFLDYGDKRYFDPGQPEAQVFVGNVVSDIVRRYDVDAIHFDDYFYPYRITGKDFPDTATYRLYGNGMTRDDWRRSNVDSIIVRLHRVIKEANPDCRFGISPFGVWRNQDKDPRGSATKAGQTNYDDLYADILLWLRNDWIDYVAPQLYWEFSHPNAPFEPLLDWWSKNSYGKPCYIGLGYYRAGSNTIWKDRTLIPRQLQAIRETPNIGGAIYFSSKSFLRNPLGWNDTLRTRYYRYPALVPPVPRLVGNKPVSPKIEAAELQRDDLMRLTVVAPQGLSGKIRQVAVYARYGDEKEGAVTRLIAVQPFAQRVQFDLACPNDARLMQYHVTYVDAGNRESEAGETDGSRIRFVRDQQGAWHRADP
jgi:uncharacterized lipoprotein YddW (UPF0748 family)